MTIAISVADELAYVGVCIFVLLFQAPHVHFLLLEAADIMGLHPLPRVQISQSAAPYVRLLRVPVMKVAATAAAGGTSNKAAGGQQQEQKQQHQRHRPQKQVSVWQRESLLVLSSAALQLMQPAELQAAMAAALVPVMFIGRCQTTSDMYWHIWPSTAVYSFSADMGADLH